MKHTPRGALVVFLCLFLLLSSGRIASSDAGQQRGIMAHGPGDSVSCNAAAHR